MADSIMHCSFCGKCADEVKKLMTGPSAAICDECIALCAEMLKEEKAGKKEPPRCSFCGKLETGQRKLIVGQSGSICNACAGKCVERFHEETIKELRRTKTRLKWLEAMIGRENEEKKNK